MACADCQQKKNNIFKQATNIAKGFTKAIINSETTQALSNPRLLICYSCPFNTVLVTIGNKKASQCEACKCICEAKTSVEDETCPKGKW